MSTVHQNEDLRGQARYSLTGTESGLVWGVCPEVEGLFGEPRRAAYELSGWVPEGAGVRGWVGREMWWVPEDATLDPWLLEDAESLGHHPGSDGLVLLLTGRDGYAGPPDGHRGRVRLHDERRWLGSCREWVRVEPPRPAEPPLVLRGLDPSEELRRALMTKSRWALDLGEAVLEIRDDLGEPFAERLLWVTVTAWRPSARGAELIDVELEGKFSTPVPEQARPLWERWLAGPPRTPGAWAGLDTRQRGAWLDHVRESACRRPLHDRPSGQAYELDGRYITDVPGLYLALGEAVNGPGGYFGGSGPALDDCLGGSFGHTAPATLLWRDAATAREHLSHALTPDGRPYDLIADTLESLAEGGMHVTLA